MTHRQTAYSNFLCAQDADEAALSADWDQSGTRVSAVTVGSGGSGVRKECRGGYSETVKSHEHRDKDRILNRRYRSLHKEH